jgi:threonine/homoserine/homoserine lactone efflux protein
MLHTLLTFIPVAALLSITPGVATALVVRNAARGGRRHAFFTTSGNSIGVLFFVALFPQFIPRGAPVLPSALAMALVIVAVDLLWFSTLAFLVARARKAFVAGGWGRRVERLTGAVLIGLGVRLALERR